MILHTVDAPIVDLSRLDLTISPFDLPTISQVVNLDHVGLRELTKEDETLAHAEATTGLGLADTARLTAIEVELDRRWKLFA